MEIIEKTFSLIVTFIFDLLKAYNINTDGAPDWLKDYVKTEDAE